MTTAREIHLAARPRDWPTAADFRTVDTELADPGPGEVLVRNTFMSVDPYMRGRMNDVKSYVPPFALDAVLDGGAVGEVIASGSDRLQWRETVVDGIDNAVDAFLGLHRGDNTGKMLVRLQPAL
jgi:NADPH-dependent curcumin reductase CurA